jgi:hypothetical protein
MVKKSIGFNLEETYGSHMECSRNDIFHKAKFKIQQHDIVVIIHMSPTSTRTPQQKSCEEWHPNEVHKNLTSIAMTVVAVLVTIQMGYGSTTSNQTYFMKGAPTYLMWKTSKIPNRDLQNPIEGGKNPSHRDPLHHHHVEAPPPCHLHVVE